MEKTSYKQIVLFKTENWWDIWHDDISSTRGDKNSEDVDDEDLRSDLPVNTCSSITQLEELEDKLKSKASYDYEN